MVSDHPLLHPANDKSKQDLGIYIHIPFCVKKCDYCDFLSAPASDEIKKRYILAILQEIYSYKDLATDYQVPTIFIGGGTPSSINGSYIEEIMRALQAVFDINKSTLEATIEINPGTIDKEKLLSYQRAGLNRISFGLQSSVKEELKSLGRIHSFEDFLKNYHLARELGFDNINVDLMSALPGQTIDSWERTLAHMIALSPEHISAYSLIIEEGTPFFDRYQKQDKTQGIANDILPDEDTDRYMYERTKEILSQNGFERYEISNYAKRGYECRHNKVYWSTTQYLGIGLGASSLINHTRFHNTTDLKEYLSLCNQEEKEGDNLRTLSLPGSLRRDMEILSVKEQMEEFMFLGLRLCEGIEKKEFFHRFHKSVEEVYPDVIKSLQEKQLLIAKGDRWYLSDYGIDISNVVLAEFLLPE